MRCKNGFFLFYFLSVGSIVEIPFFTSSKKGFEDLFVFYIEIEDKNLFEKGWLI